LVNGIFEVAAQASYASANEWENGEANHWPHTDRKNCHGCWFTEWANTLLDVF